MPVVVFANPKGGVGKSTSSLVLGTTLADMGIQTSIIDADPRQLLRRWGEKSSTKNPVTIIGNADENMILTTIDDRAALDQIVIVDLEGTASRLTSHAISRADLVIVPMQATAPDADGASEVMNMIKQEERAFRRKIDARVMFNRTNPAIRTKIENQLIQDLQNSGCPTLETRLHQRQAYSLIFAAFASLPEMEIDPELSHHAGGVAKARENAEVLAAEVYKILAEQQAGASEAGAA